MNWEQVERQWDHVKAQAHAKWDKLTEDDISTIQGKREQLVGRLVDRYGYNKRRAEREIDLFASGCEDKKDA